MTALIVAALSCAIWIYLLSARGGFWRAAQRDEALDASLLRLGKWPRVLAVVPARNEAEVIGVSIASLLRQSYPGMFAIIVVDDHSEDGTGTIARHAAEAVGAA